MQDVATLEEIKTAKNLTSSRSKIFLETKAYLQQSLSTLFNLDPLEILTNAHPGEPPSLPLRRKTSLNPKIICCSKKF